MKRVIGVALFAVVLAFSAFAQGMAHEPRSVDAIVADILARQRATELAKVKVADIPSALLVELGDAVMGEIIGDNEKHEKIDDMLGGDDSPVLSITHAALGAQYLKEKGAIGLPLMEGTIMSSWMIMPRDMMMNHMMLMMMPMMMNEMIGGQTKSEHIMR
jgi:hypothetical protein